MNSIILVAALNSGLRGRKGHITLISEESATADKVVERIATCASIVRDAAEGVTLDEHFTQGSDFVVGKEFAGVWKMVVQETSGRLAPEVFLVWNCDIKRLTEPQKTRLIEWLRQLSGDRSDLIREVSAMKKQQTTVFSQSLKAWAATYCASLPALQGNLSPVVVGKNCVPNLRAQTTRPSWSTLSVLAIVILFMIGMSFLWLHKHSDSLSEQPTTQPPKMTSTAVSPLASKSEKGQFAKWMSEMTDLERAAREGMRPHAQLTSDILRASQELKATSFSSVEYEQAYDRIRQIAELIQASIVADIDKSILGQVRSEQAREFDEYRSIQQKADDFDAELRNLNDVNTEIGGQKIGEKRGYAKKRFFRGLLAIVLDNCRMFHGDDVSSEAIKQIEWLSHAMDSDFAKELQDNPAAEDISALLKSMQTLRQRIKLEVRFDDARLSSPIDIWLIASGGEDLPADVYSPKPSGGNNLPKNSQKQTLLGSSFEIPLEQLLVCRTAVIKHKKCDDARIGLDFKVISIFVGRKQGNDLAGRSVKVNGDANLIVHVGIYNDDGKLREAFKKLVNAIAMIEHHQKKRP